MLGRNVQMVTFEPESSQGIFFFAEASEKSSVYTILRPMKGQYTLGFQILLYSAKPKCSGIWEILAGKQNHIWTFGFYVITMSSQGRPVIDLFVMLHLIWSDSNFWGMNQKVTDNSQKLFRWSEHSIRKDFGTSGAWEDDSELLSVCCGYFSCFPPVG